MLFAKLRLELIILALIFDCTTAAWAQSPFTVEQVVSSSFPSQLVASTHSSRVAWVFDAKGVRNVCLADGPDFVRTARPVTHYGADDGQSISSLRLTPDGQTMHSARGSQLKHAPY